MVEKHHDFDELFDLYDRNLDRFSSMLNTIFVVGGVFIAVIVFILNPPSVIVDKIIEPNFILCFLFLLLSLLIVIGNMVNEGRHSRINKLIKSDNSVKYRDEAELKEIYFNLYSVIRKQHKYYNIVVISTLCSFYSFYNHFKGVNISLRYAILIIGFVGVLSIIILPCRKKTSVLLESGKKLGILDYQLKLFSKIKSTDCILISMLSFAVVYIICFLLPEIEIPLILVLSVFFILFFVYSFYLIWEV